MKILQNTYTDNLPKQTQQKMLFSFADILSVDIDNSTTDRACRVDDQDVILVDSECTQFSFVDGTLVNSLGRRQVDHFTINKRSYLH